MNNRKEYKVKYIDYNDQIQTIFIRSSIKRNIISQLKKIIDNLMYDDVEVIDYEIM